VNLAVLIKKQKEQLPDAITDQTMAFCRRMERNASRATVLSQVLGSMQAAGGEPISNPVQPPSTHFQVLPYPIKVQTKCPILAMSRELHGY
jgi:hypothetical protein